MSNVDDEAAESRFAALVNGRQPQKPERAPKSGAAKWVRTLYDKIASTRANGGSWEYVASLLNQAAVPLINGHKWTADNVCKVFIREKRRREKAGGVGRVELVASDMLSKPAQAAGAAGDVVVAAQQVGSPPQTARGGGEVDASVANAWNGHRPPRRLQNADDLLAEIDAKNNGGR